MLVEPREARSLLKGRSILRPYVDIKWAKEALGGYPNPFQGGSLSIVALVQAAGDLKPLSLSPAASSPPDEIPGGWM